MKRSASSTTPSFTLTACNRAPRARDYELGAPAADVEKEKVALQVGQALSHAEESQPRFFLARDHPHLPAARRTDLRKKLGAVVRFADSTGPDDTHIEDPQLFRATAEAGNHLRRPPDRGRLEDARARLSLSQPRHALFRV